MFCWSWRLQLSDLEIRCLRMKTSLYSLLLSNTQFHSDLVPITKQSNARYYNRFFFLQYEQCSWSVQLNCHLFWLTSRRNQQCAEIGTIGLSNFTFLFFFFILHLLRFVLTARLTSTPTSCLVSINGGPTLKTPAVRVQGWETGINPIKQRFPFLRHIIYCRRCLSD